MKSKIILFAVKIVLSFIIFVVSVKVSEIIGLALGRNGMSSSLAMALAVGAILAVWTNKSIFQKMIAVVTSSLVGAVTWTGGWYIGGLLARTGPKTYQWNSDELFVHIPADAPYINPSTIAIASIFCSAAAAYLAIRWTAKPAN